MMFQNQKDDDRVLQVVELRRVVLWPLWKKQTKANHDANAVVDDVGDVAGSSAMGSAMGQPRLLKTRAMKK